MSSKSVEATREMKDSGVEWIGEIPSNWMLSKIGAQCKIFGRIGYRGYTVEDLVDKGNGVITLGPSNIVNNKLDLSKQTYLSFEKYEESPEIKVYPGDIILVKTASVGKVAIIENTDEKLTLNPQLVVLKNIKCNNKFLYYLLASPVIEKQISDGIQNTVLSTITQAQIKKYCFPIPALHEQQAIATYLDEQVGRLNELISEQKQAIEKWKAYKQSLITETVTKGLNPEVEMKDSGVEWIGEIPCDWDTRKGKFILKLLKRSIKESDEVITCFRDGEVTLRSNRREDGFTLSLKEIGYQGIEPDDLVIHGMDGFAGAIGISDSRGKGSPVLNVCDSLFGCKKYYMYYLRSLAINNVFLALATGIRERSCDLRWNKIANLDFILPSIDEQQAIANYLDKKCAVIDQTIEQKELLIKQLEEYKQSLIYEYVTGKRRVL